ncbi:MAG TPA: TadE/TadG family type IV pilus assembly protein [Candidatus Limnocylindrales bacterium]|nr:TadE/TadG family type IV pilus assembly protein [Candidatus Limnocylindrales bacterium]
MRSERGGSLVEVAMLLPILTLLLLGTIDLGRLAYMSIEVSNAARAGVQYGQQNSSTWADVQGMQTAAANDAPDLVGAGNGNLTITATYWCQCADGSAVTASCSPNAPSCTGTHLVNYVKVVSTATYKPWFSCAGIPSTTTLNGQAVMRAGQ